MEILGRRPDTGGSGNQSSEQELQDIQDPRDDQASQHDQEEESKEKPHLSQQLKYRKYFEQIRGYPRFSTWIASDPCFAIGRDYSDLRVRIRLYKQFKVERARRKLDELDKLMVKWEDNIDSFENILHSHQRPDQNAEEIMEELHQALKEFDEIQLREKAYRSLPRPSKRNYRSLLNQLDGSQDVDSKEEEFFLYPREMVSLSGGQEQSWLDQQIERVLQWIPLSQKIFTEKELRKGQYPDQTIYYTRNRVAVLARALIVIMAAGSVVIPVAILTSITSHQNANLGVVTGWMVLFPLVLSLCASLSHQEVFGVTAAYAAMLVVFLSNSLPQKVTCSGTPE